MIPAKNKQIKISSSSDNLRLLERLVEDVCDVFNVNEDCYGNILIAVTEAFNNAMYHGNKNDPEKNVNVGFESENGLITFIVSDEGSGFDYHNLPDPTEPHNLDKPHGRGVFLMKNLADNVSFLNNGQEVRLSFKII